MRISRRTRRTAVIAHNAGTTVQNTVNGVVNTVQSLKVAVVSSLPWLRGSVASRDAAVTSAAPYRQHVTAPSAGLEGSAAMRMDTVLHYARLRAPSFHEAVPEVEDLTQDTVLTRQPRGVCGLGVCTSATTLAARSLPVPRGQGGDISHARSPHHGRRPHWMGRRPEGADSQGTWSPALRTMHINHLGLMAVLLALKRFEPLVRGCHVLIRTDNTATIYYINKQGGLVSPTLDALARELTLWCNSRLESIRASHVAGRQNSGADLLSRGRYR